MRKSLAIASLSLLAITGCAGNTEKPIDTKVEMESAVSVDQAAFQIKTIRQGDFLREVKKMLSSETKMNEIQLLAAGYEACLSVNEGNKDAYREKVMAESGNIESGLDQLVIAAGAKALLCP